MKKQLGEIGTLLTIVAVMLMTAGVFLGSALVSKFSAPSSRTQAQATSPIVPNAANQDIEARFGTISNRGGTDQKMIETFICFKGTGNPPSIGRYKIEAQVVLKNGDAPISIGGSLEEPISNPLDRYRCNSEMRHVVYTYKSIEDIPGDITYDQVEKIEFVFTSITGNWDPLPAGVIGTMTDMTEIFGPRPSPPAAPDMIVCPQTSSLSPLGVINDVRRDPSLATGWNVLENPNLPESATNRRKRSLVLQDMSKTHHPETNKLLFAAECPTIPTTPRPGKLTFNVKMNNTAFTGDFDGFEYVLHSCSFNDKNSDGSLNEGEAENCDVAPNFKGQIVTIKKEGPAAINKVDTKTFDLPAGKRVIYMDYGFWKKYGTTQARKDVTGVEVTYSPTCSSLLEKTNETGPAKCLITIDGDTSVEAAVKLPDAAKAVYRLAYSTKVADGTSDYKGAEIANCSVGSNAQNTSVSGLCSKDNQVPIPALIYSNSTQTATKVAYVITRCTGDSATVCKPNKFFTDTIDVKNIFSEAALFELTPGNRRICKFDPSKFPTTDITDAKVREAVSCNTVPVPTPPPTEVAEYYANLSLYNSSTKNIVHAKTRACANGITCTDDEQDLEIAPGTRELVSIKIGSIKPETNFYTLRVYVRLDGSETDRGLTEEFNVQDPQSVYYDLKVSDTAVDGSAETELDASDVSGNKCVNADDAAKVIAKLAEFTSPDQCIPEDINCDGVVNILDLAVIIPNLNGGTGCAANQPLIAPNQSIIAP
ncbi:hypothetical protein KBC70_00510 [Candidatus Woesebacteria bacterium]|nr:hypothetical protein [Candidatus Woesebacteria bacterium]